MVVGLMCAHRTILRHSVVAGCKTDLQRAIAMCHWTHGLWKHNGNNKPVKSDPLSIVEEARKGKKFRCVEYAVVVSGCLNAVGVRARVLGLKTEDVETRESGVGHVVAEAYLGEFGKWTFVDAQWDVIPIRQGVPLNAVELRKAIVEQQKGLELSGLSFFKSVVYRHRVKPYLFYIDTRLDCRVGVSGSSRKPETLMLVPVGAREPRVFQRKWPMKNLIYTHSVRSFYARPL